MTGVGGGLDVGVSRSLSAGRRNRGLTRRGFLAGAGGLLLLGGAGCGGGEGRERASGGDSGTRTIEHELGTTEVSGRPERVVTLDYICADLAAALGVQPVAINVYPEFRGAGGVPPWIGAEIEAGEVEFVDIGDGIPIERVASLEPDLVLAMYTAITQDEYDSLSQVVPTVAYQTDPYADAWRGISRAAGTALGRGREARGLVTETEAEIDSVVEGHPRFPGKTFMVANVFTPDQVGVIVSEQNPTVRLLASLGLEPSPNLSEVPLRSDNATTGDLSLERLDLLDNDLLFINYVTPEAQEALKSNQLFQQLGVVQRGAAVAFEPDEWNGFRAPSVLSIPYVLDGITPRIEAAIDGSGTETKE